ncbi:MAG: DNA-binding response regulator [Saprospiraceae bacterium]
MANNVAMGIIEDDPYLQENLHDFFDLQPDIDVKTVCGSVEDFLHLPKTQKQIDLLLLDIGLPGMDGIAGISYIHDQLPNLDIIILTSFDDADKIFNALKAGAVSYLTKKTPLPKIRDVVITVSRGGSYMSPEIARKVVGYFNPSPQVRERLTPRQNDIVDGLVKGLSYQKIADHLYISVETVRDHIKKIYRKLQVNSKAEVIRLRMEGRL